MLKASYSRRRHRKLRLFAVACCRRNWPLLSDERSKRAIDVAERYADANAKDEELREAGNAVHIAHREAFKGIGKTGACLEWAAAYVTDPVAFLAAKRVSWMSATPRETGHFTGAEYLIQGNLVRDIFGNPFRPVTFDPSWRTLSVVGLAQTMYDNRAFDQMSDLADALERAGCRDEAILDHCRMPGEHVRGCWVLDLVLGKE